MKIPGWKQGVAALAMLALASALAGCKGFWDAPPNNGGTTLTSNDFYIVNSSSIYGASIQSGVLTALTGSPWSVTGAQAMAIEPNGTFAYIGTTSGIYLYTIDASTGALAVTGIFDATCNTNTLAVDPAGAWLLAICPSGSNSVLVAYPINSFGGLGTGTTHSVTLAGNSVAAGQLVIEPSGGWVFVAEGSSGVQGFTFNSASTGSPFTGTVWRKTPTNSNGSATAVAVDPQSRLLYLTELDAFPSSSSNSGGLFAYTIGTATLTALSGSPWASGGTGPNAILPEANGNYVYVANWAGTSDGNVTGFSVTTTALTLLSSTISTGVKPAALVEDSSKNFVLALNGSDSTSLDAYYFDTTTAGKLDLGLTATTSTTGSSPVTVVAAP